MAGKKSAPSKAPAKVGGMHMMNGIPMKDADMQKMMGAKMPMAGPMPPKKMPMKKGK